MATEHTSVSGASEVKLLVHISGQPLVVSWSDLHVRTLPGRKSADIASISAFPVHSRTRESVRCTKSPRPTVLEVFDGSVLESVRYETATSP